MSVFSSHTKKKVALFDIGSGSVGIAYTSLTGEKPTILYAKRRYFEENTRPNIERYFSRVLWAATSTATEMAMNKEYAEIGEVHCFIPSLLTYREVRKISYKGKNFVVSRSFVGELVKKETEAIKHEDKNKEGKILLEKKILNIELNGYSIADPFDKKADEITITLYISYTDEYIVERLKNIIHKVFHLDKIYFHGAPLSLYATLGMLFPNEENFTLFNTSSEVSDLIISTDSELVQIISFPYGKNTLLRLLGRELGVDLHEASALLNLYRLKKLDEKINKRVHDALIVGEQMWRESFKHTIGAGNLRGGLPARIFLAGDPSFTALLPEWFKNGRKELFSTEGSENFSIKELNREALERFVVYGPRATNDPHLLLLSLFTNNLK